MSRNTTKLARGVATIVVMVLVATACNPPVDWSQGGDERRWWCDPTDTAINDGHSGGTHASPYTEEKGPLTWEHCAGNALLLERAAAYAELFPTKGVAEANGWHWLAPWIPGQGTHHVRPEGIPTTLDAKTPTMLMFDGNGANAPLTGMVFVVQSGHMPPAGFPGDNDHWHNHHMLCYTAGPFIVGDGISDAACAARGGTNVDSSDTWLLHVWLPVYDGWEATDIFNKTHPGI